MSERDASAPVCTSCNDSHRWPSGNMCTACPRPCEKCRGKNDRGNRTGPYCDETPCSCTCHEHHIQYAARREREQRTNEAPLTHEDAYPTRADCLHTGPLNAIEILARDRDAWKQRAAQAELQLAQRTQEAKCTAMLATPGGGHHECGVKMPCPHHHSNEATSDAALGTDDHAIAGMLEYLVRVIEEELPPGDLNPDEGELSGRFYLAANIREAKKRAKWLRERGERRVNRPDNPILGCACAWNVDGTIALVGNACSVHGRLGAGAAAPRVDYAPPTKTVWMLDGPFRGVFTTEAKAKKYVENFNKRTAHLGYENRWSLHEATLDNEVPRTDSVTTPEDPALDKAMTEAAAFADLRASANAKRGFRP